MVTTSIYCMQERDVVYLEFEVTRKRTGAVTLFLRCLVRVLDMTEGGLADEFEG